MVQHKGWSYHALPVRLLAGLLAVVLAARWLDRALPGPRAIRAAPALAVVAAFGLGIHGFAGAEAPWRQITWSWSRGGEVTALLKREAYGERLLVLSPDIFPVFPALNYARAQSTLRTMNLWLLQGVYQDCPAGGARYRETWEMSRAEFFVYRTVAEDFSRTRRRPPSWSRPGRASRSAARNSTCWSISAATPCSPRRCAATALQPRSKATGCCGARTDAPTTIAGRR